MTAGWHVEITARARRDLRNLDPPVRAPLNEDGTAAAKQRRIVVALEPARRNELWLADHKQLDVWVLPLRGKQPVKPWVTLIMDGKSRRVLGAALSLRPSQAHVLAALRQAIATAGVAETLLFDRGLEFTADAIAAVATELAFAALPTRGYSPNHKNGLGVGDWLVFHRQQYPSTGSTSLTRSLRPGKLRVAEGSMPSWVNGGIASDYRKPGGL